MSNCKSISTPKEKNQVMMPIDDEPVEKKRHQAVIGSITYAVAAKALGSVNQFAPNPSKEHWTAVKRILSCIQEKLNH